LYNHQNDCDCWILVVVKLQANIVMAILFVLTPIHIFFLIKKHANLTSKILYNQIDDDCWILVGDDKITSKYCDGNPFCIDTDHIF